MPTVRRISGNLALGAPQLRIVHYISEVVAEHGGVVKAVLDLCGALSDRGHEVTLLTQNPQDIPSEWREKTGKPTVYRVRFSRNPFSRPSFGPAAKAIDQAEVVHLHTPWELTNPPLARELQRRSKPYIVSVHGMLDDWSMAQRGLKKRAYLTVAGRRFLENAFRVHCTAAGECQQASKWMPKAETAVMPYTVRIESIPLIKSPPEMQTAVLPLLVNLSEYDTLPGPEPALAAFPQLATAAPKILFLSRLHPKKGVEILLQAAAEVARRGVPLELFIAGPGEDDYVKKLKRLATELNLGATTHFLGMVRGTEKTSLYQAADLFVLPTHQENFGLVLIEALACGTPVITTPGVDIWPELEQAGSMIVSADPQAVAHAILERLGQRGQLAELGARGREFVNDWLAEENVIASYEAMYAAAARSQA